MPIKIKCLYSKKSENNNINNNFSKEKTNDKTQFKINENKNMENCGIKSKNDLVISKVKINFELNKN